MTDLIALAAWCALCLGMGYLVQAVVQMLEAEE